MRGRERKRTQISVFTVALLSMLLGVGFGTPARAFNPFGNGQADSYAIINACPPGADCLYLAWIADPPSANVTGLSTGLTYDPSDWIFQPSLSAFLCGFSVGGDCPPADPVVGTYPLSSLPLTTVTPGGPLPGSSYSLVDDSVLGQVVLNYSLATPMPTGSVDQNFFEFVFEAVVPFDPTYTTVSFFDTPGSYQFNQIGCTMSVDFAETGCHSDTAIYGFNVSVPEPTALSLLAASVLFLALARRRARPA